MGVYTDEKQLAVREAVERLPRLTPNPAAESAHDCARIYDSRGHFLSSTDTMGRMTGRSGKAIGEPRLPRNVSEKPSVAFAVTEGHRVEQKRFELSTSSLRTKRSPS